MPRKRDHKAEYAARKAKAQALGYSGVSEYRKTRKELALPRTRRTPSRRAVVRYRPTIVDRIAPRLTGIGKLRREAETWSQKHSHSRRSEYRPNMTDAEVRVYHRAYVQRVTGMSRRKAAKEKRKRIFEYLSEFDFIEEKEWREDWKSDLGA